jgi:ribosomal protein L30E
MFYYLTSDAYKDFFNSLSEQDIINKEVKHHMTFEEMLKFIKKDLRNVEVECLAIDMSIMEFEDGQSFNDILDILYVLNPFSKIIIINVPAQNDLNKSANLLILQDNEEAADLLNRFLNQDRVTDRDTDTVQEHQKCPNEIKEKPKNSKKTVKTEDHKKMPAEKVIKQKRLILPPEERFQEPEISSSNTFDPEKIYNKAANPNKITEGIPLKKRILQGLDPDTVPNSKTADVIKINTRQIRQIKEPANTVGQWICSNVVIAMVGTERKVGTTAAAINLALFLSTSGAKVTYSEANMHDHLSALAKEYDYIEEEGHYVYNSLSLFRDSEFDLEAGMNFIILDLGSFAEGEQIQQRQLKILKEVAAHVIIISGKQPYEQKALLYALYLTSDNEVNILFSNTAEEEIGNLKEKYKMMANIISYVPYEPIINRLCQWPEDLQLLFSKESKEPDPNSILETS